MSAKLEMICVATPATVNFVRGMSKGVVVGESLADIVRLEFGKFAKQFTTVGISGDSLNDPTHCQAKLADAWLAVHPLGSTVMRSNVIAKLCPKKAKNATTLSPAQMEASAPLRRVSFC